MQLKLFQVLFNRIGYPDVILSGNGTQLVSRVMRSFTGMLFIAQMFCLRYHPISNGIVEKLNCCLKQILLGCCLVVETDIFLKCICAEVRRDCLTELTAGPSTNNHVKQSSFHEQALKEIQRSSSSKPFLRNPDLSLDFYVFTDSSSIALS